MYRLTKAGQRSKPLPGVPWREMTDAEFRAAEAHAGGPLKRYFERVPDEPKERPAPQAASAAKEE